MSNQCRRCAGIFHPSSCKSGENICKSCATEQAVKWHVANRERILERKRQYHAERREFYALSREYDDVMSEHEGEAMSLLYLMRYEFDPCGTMGVKIGRTKNLAARVAELERAHNFRMKVLRVYKGLGNLEPLVHRLLAGRRASGGPSKEWFDVSFATAMKAVALARALGPGADWHEAASVLSESLDDEDSAPPVGQCETL